MSRKSRITQLGREGAPGPLIAEEPREGVVDDIEEPETPEQADPETTGESEEMNQNQRHSAATMFIREKYGKDFRIVTLGATQAVITNGKVRPKINLPTTLHHVTD